MHLNSKISIFTALLLIFVAQQIHAQDSLFLWSGTVKEVRITGVDINGVSYQSFRNPNAVRYIEVHKIMDIHCADPSCKWISQLRPPELFGIIPENANGVDSLAKKHVATYYLGGRNSGKGVLLSTLLGTPVLGIINAGIESSEKPTVEGLGMMGNPHQNNADYVNCYLKHAKKEKLTRVWLNFVGGTIVFSIPVVVMVLAAQSMSVGSLGF